jgi:hypothetical protein
MERIVLFCGDSGFSKIREVTEPCQPGRPLCPPRLTERPDRGYGIRGSTWSYPPRLAATEVILANAKVLAVTFWHPLAKDWSLRQIPFVTS